jgi:hypothetical protein
MVHPLRSATQSIISRSTDGRVPRTVNAAESDVAVHDYCVTEREPTVAEHEFFGVLADQIADLQDWYHVDADGRPWMMVSYDLVRDHAIRATWRLDFDGEHMVGGLSPALLNWDAETRAAAAGVDTGAPEGIDADVTSPREAALIAADWFRQRIT